VRPQPTFRDYVSAREGARPVHTRKRSPKPQFSHPAWKCSHRTRAVEKGNAQGWFWTRAGLHRAIGLQQACPSQSSSITAYEVTEKKDQPPNEAASPCPSTSLGLTRVVNCCHAEPREMTPYGRPRRSVTSAAHHDAPTEIVLYGIRQVSCTVRSSPFAIPRCLRGTGVYGTGEISRWPRPASC
jgi:hypothetical protein